MPQLASFDSALFARLREIYQNFDENDAQRVKDIEKVTNHDVKAVEYLSRKSLIRLADWMLTRSLSISV